MNPGGLCVTADCSGHAVSTLRDTVRAPRKLFLFIDSLGWKRVIPVDVLVAINPPGHQPSRICKRGSIRGLYDLFGPKWRQF